MVTTRTEGGIRPLDRIADLLREGVREGVFSAASAAWRHGHRGFQASAGFDSVGPVTGETRFDLASLTKLFTTGALLRLVDQGRLDLSEPLGAHGSPPIPTAVCEATIEQALRHTAGAAHWHPFFQRVPPETRGTPRAKAAIVAQAWALPEIAPPGARTVYSDIGFILLGHILESTSGAPLSELIHQEVIAPLGLESVSYGPLALALDPPIRVAATEACPWRGRRLIGEVHDDNAWAMGGTAGHAGLFGAAMDLARFGAAWLPTGPNGWLSKNARRSALSRPENGRGLGWDVTSRPYSAAGTRMSDAAMGHLGFTGCSLWIDPERDLSVALLTNRVCFGRDNNQIRGFRPVFHDAVLGSL